MSLTITGVSAAAATDFAAPAPPTELPVSDFVAILQNSPMSGMPQLANPAVLAGELFNHLRGFVERAHYYENLKLTPVQPADDGNVTLASAAGERLAGPPGGPARNNSGLADLAPAGEEGSSTSQPVDNSLSDTQRKNLADLHRVMEFCLAMLNFSVEATVVAGGVTQGVHSINTLLKAE